MEENPGGSPSVPKFVFRVPMGAPERKSIPVATPDGPSDILFDKTGNPVWPTRSRNDGEALEAMCEVFDGSVVRVDALAGEIQPPSSNNELVLGIGNVEREARLYAHLTGRRYEIVPLVHDHHGQDPSVIIGSGSSVDVALIESLSLRPAETSPPGIIWGRTGDELRQRVLTCSCAATLSTPMTVPQVDVVGPRLGSSGEKLTNLVELREALASRSGLLVLYAHGDGIAQELPAGSALCARAETNWKGDPRKAPVCVFTGYCRLGLRVEEALASGRLVKPSALAARVLVDISCQAAFVGNRVLDSTWSVFAALMRNPRIGALLAPSHIFRVTGVLEGDLLSRLREGHQIGSALAAYESSPDGKSLKGHLLLFGDPRVRVSSNTAAPRLVSHAPAATMISPISGRVSHEPEPNTGAMLTTLREIAKLTRSDTLRTCRSTSQHLLKCIKDFEDHANSSDAPLPESALQSATLGHLALVKGRLSKAWETEVVSASRGPLTRCPNCSLRAYVSLETLRSGITREVFKCLACGDVADYQVNRHPRPLVNVPFVGLNGDAPTRGTGTILFVRPRAIDTVSLPWPRQQDGHSINKFKLEAELAMGPWEVRAIYIDGLAVHSASGWASGAELAAPSAPHPQPAASRR